MQSSEIGTWNLAGRASRGGPPSPPLPLPAIPEPVVEHSIFWLSVEEEVLSTPPGGEVYLKSVKTNMDQSIP